MSPTQSQGNDEQLSGSEPQLGGNNVLPLTGYEPLLGGIRRAGADMSRVLALVNAEQIAERERILRMVRRLGQIDVYAQELAQVVPRRARIKTGNWRGSFTPGQRIRAMETLQQIGSYESLVPLLDVLSDDTYAVRRAAEKSLTAICTRLDPSLRQTRIAFKALVESLRELPLIARKVVARILADAPPDLVLGPLLSDGLDAPEWYARREAAWTLGKLGDQRATHRLIDTLADPSSAVRSSTAWALGHLQAPIAIQPLMTLLDDQDEVVRAAAIEALGTLASRLSRLDPDLTATLDRIIGMLHDSDMAVRHAALEALVDLQHRPEARQALNRFVNKQ